MVSLSLKSDVIERVEVYLLYIHQAEDQYVCASAYIRTARGWSNYLIVSVERSLIPSVAFGRQASETHFNAYY